MFTLGIDLSMGAIIGIGVGVLVLALTILLGCLVAYYVRFARRPPQTFLPADSGLNLKSPIGAYNNSSQVSPAFPSLMVTLKISSEID